MPFFTFFYFWIRKSSSCSAFFPVLFFLLGPDSELVAAAVGSVVGRPRRRRWAVDLAQR